MRRAILPIVLFLTLFTAACEDEPPTLYTPQNVVEAFLLVGDPIAGIMVMRSQPVTDTFRLPSSVIRDADVRIFQGERELRLVFRDDSAAGEYYYPDTTVRVEPNTDYRIEVRLADGSLLTGSTRTPGPIAWVRPPRDARYPTDTMHLPAPDSLGLSWTPVAGVTDYIIGVRCLDTLGYGEYLRPPTEEKNRRIVRFFESNFRDYNDLTRLGFVQATSTPISWFIFKWFGRHEVLLYAPNPELVRWYKMMYFQQQADYQPLLGNIQGGLGVFASASVARSRMFLYKNQP